MNLKNYWNKKHHTQHCIEACWVLARRFSTEVPELEYNQEEGDTRFILHTKHACDS